MSLQSRLDVSDTAGWSRPFASDSAQLEILSAGEIAVLPVGYGSSPVDGESTLLAEYFRFRQYVYVDEMRVIGGTSPAVITDADEDDARSIHVAAVERLDAVGTYRVVGSMRLIVCGTVRNGQLEAFGLDPTSEPLPFEVDFASANLTVEIDLSEGRPLMCEISRYIARHEAKATKYKIAMAIHKAAAYMVVTHSISRTFATVERWLDRSLRMSGVPLERVSEQILLEKYQSRNHAIEVDMYALAEKLEGVSRIGVISTSEIDGVLRLPQADTRPLAAVTDHSSDPRLARNLGFWSAAEQNAISRSHVAIAGVGGDGYLLGLSLLRMGVKSFSIADPEVFEAENINRVPGATSKSVGRRKVDCFIEDAKAIDPSVTIRAFRAGVTAGNVDDFLAGADVIVDETELTMLELGTMISDAAQKNDLPVVVVMNIGFAAQVTTMSPDGAGFREMMGIPADESLDAIAQRDVDFSRCIPYIAPYTDLDVLKVVQQGAPLPSIVQGVNLASALGASQCFLLLTRGIEHGRPAPVTYPTVMYVDSLTGESSKIDDVTASFERSMTRMEQSERAGETPKLTYP